VNYRNVVGLFGVLLMLGLSACSPNSMGPSMDEKVADDLVKAYFTDFVNGDADKLVSYYSDEFLRMTPKEEWKAKLQGIFDKYGKAKSYSVASKQYDIRFSGKFYIYRYDTWHNNKKRIKHIMTLRRPVDSETKLLLVGHKIDE